MEFATVYTHTLEVPEREFFIDNLLVRIHYIIEIIWRTGLAPWEFEFPFPGSLISTFLEKYAFTKKTEMEFATVYTHTLEVPPSSFLVLYYSQA